MALSASERLRIVNEVKIKCMSMDITDELATIVLFKMLDNYYRDGTVYIGKELNSARSGRRFIINLYNDPSRKDTVVVRPIAEE